MSTLLRFPISARCPVCGDTVEAIVHYSPDDTPTRAVDYDHPHKSHALWRALHDAANDLLDVARDGAPPCRMCGQPGHTDCGFCSRCREHCVFLRLCAFCEEPADDTACLQSPYGKHFPDEFTESLSECCGASGWAYDDEPPNYHEDR